MAKVKGSKRTRDFLAETFFKRDERRKPKNLKRKLSIEFTIEELKEIKIALDIAKAKATQMSMQAGWSAADREKIINSGLIYTNLLKDFENFGI